MDKVGEVYEGIISGVTNFGLFVELKDIFVEGLVHITALGNDYYRFDPVKHRLMGERTRQTFGLGDMVSVQVARVDLDEARIDFELKDFKLKKSNRSTKTGKKKSESRKKVNTKKAKKKKSKQKKSGRTRSRR